MWAGTSSPLRTSSSSPFTGTSRPWACRYMVSSPARSTSPAASWASSSRCAIRFSRVDQRGPARAPELALGVAHELLEGGVDLLEAAVQRDQGQRLVGVVEAGARLAGRRLGLGRLSGGAARVLTHVVAALGLQVRLLSQRERLLGQRSRRRDVVARLLQSRAQILGLAPPAPRVAPRPRAPVTFGAPPCLCSSELISPVSRSRAARSSSSARSSLPTRSSCSSPGPTAAGAGSGRGRCRLLVDPRGLAERPEGDHQPARRESSDPSSESPAAASIDSSAVALWRRSRVSLSS